jgi:hypothetical protein
VHVTAPLTRRERMIIRHVLREFPHRDDLIMDRRTTGCPGSPSCATRDPEPVWQTRSVIEMGMPTATQAPPSPR